MKPHVDEKPNKFIMYLPYFLAALGLTNVPNFWDTTSVLAFIFIEALAVFNWFMAQKHKRDTEEFNRNMHEIDARYQRRMKEINERFALPEGF